MVETGYRQLIVQRHAKTEQEAASDRVRRLTDRGRSDATEAGRWLLENDLVPDLILTSSAVRAETTARLVTAAMGDAQPEYVSNDALYGADADEVIRIVAEAADTDGELSRVLVVGHNPTMEQLAYDVQAEPSTPWGDHLPTAGIAVFEINAAWKDLRLHAARLVDWQVPRG